jgi:hypothetical protein
MWFSKRLQFWVEVDGVGRLVLWNHYVPFVYTRLFESPTNASIRFFKELGLPSITPEHFKEDWNSGDTIAINVTLSKEEAAQLLVGKEYYWIK